jgi:hypothetical protein
VRRWWGEFAGTPPNETGVVVEVEVLATGEHKLILGGNQLFKVDIVVGVVVVGLAIALAIPCVHHLMVW